MYYIAFLFPRVVHKQTLGDVARWELERSFDGQLCHECSYRKLLKSDRPNSSLGYNR